MGRERAGSIRDALGIGEEIMFWEGLAYRQYIVPLERIYSRSDQAVPAASSMLTR